MTNPACPACGEQVVNSLNSDDCDFLLIEEFPELVLPAPSMTSRWQKDEWTTKKILVNELAKVGMVLAQFQVISVFPHHDDNPCPPDNCYQFGLEQTRNAMENKKGVIILGGNLCKEMTGYELKQVQGLSGVDFLLGYDAGDMPRVFLPTLRTIYSTGAGEFAIGLQRFAKMVGANE